MSTAKIIFITLLAGIISVGAGILGHRYLEPTPDAPTDSSLIPQPMQALTSLPDFSYPNLKGQQEAANQWAGKVLILNFWATWCPPCRKEIPAFIDLQEELGDQGLQFVGIAIDDPQAVDSFAEAGDMNYPVLIGDKSAIELSKRLGNRFQGLPFSVIFDRKGSLQYTQAGELTPQTIREKIAPLL